MIRYFILIMVLFTVSCSQVEPPKAVLPIPSERQLAWHEMEYYGFIHFTVNTFTDVEWGMGGESPEVFNPSELDCRQWARVCKEAGMKGIILTAKHHDGFCLWPSKYTEHSVKNSPWKNGQGDVVQDLLDACKEYGLKLGLYLSPWDRNHAEYGNEKYIEYFRNQLQELMTSYGDVFEVWFDGANGGTGYYGGANEERRIDRETYYDWENTRQIVRDLQPGACMFSDAGPDIRWVGNESGYANEENWSILRREEFYPGTPRYKELQSGHEDGTHWVPAEADVSIRPSWFYRKHEDEKVKTLPHLLDIYYHSIGRNASLLLNFPVDPRGLIHEKDVEQVLKLGKAVKADFSTNLALGKTITASDVRGNSKKYKAENTVDENKTTYWATNDDVIQASLTLDFGAPTEFNRFMIQEYIQLGQRVKEFSIDALIDDKWEEIDHQTTVGHKRILRFEKVKATKLRLNIMDAKACPVISAIGVYNAPDHTEAPQQELNANVVSKEKWRILGKFKENEKARVIFDGDKSSAFNLGNKAPVDIVIDMGENLQLKGFTYMPDQTHNNPGIIFNYQLSVSEDGKNWGTPVSEGEFSNIKNSPVLQTKRFNVVTCRYVKFRALSPAIENGDMGIAEIDVITH